MGAGVFYTHFGATWAILGALWPILGAIWAPAGRQGAPKIDLFDTKLHQKLKNMGQKLLWDSVTDVQVVANLFLKFTFLKAFVVGVFHFIELISIT